METTISDHMQEEISLLAICSRYQTLEPESEIPPVIEKAKADSENRLQSLIKQMPAGLSLGARMEQETELFDTAITVVTNEERLGYANPPFVAQIAAESQNRMKVLVAEMSAGENDGTT